MKKLVIILMFFAASSVDAQKLFSIHNWSDSTAFRWSQPLIRGYGALSDSLANAIPGKAEFYTLNGSYYAINSWADYYYWFTKAYWYRFNRPVIEYETFYLLGDDFLMVDWLLNQYDDKEFPDLMRVEDPFNRNLVAFNSLLLDKLELKQIRKDRKKISDDSKRVDLARMSKSDRIFGSFSSSGSGSSGQTVGRSSSSGSSGESNSSKSIGN